VGVPFVAALAICLYEQLRRNKWKFRLTYDTKYDALNWETTNGSQAPVNSVFKKNSI
jgi:hypothetical protein